MRNYVCFAIKSVIAKLFFVMFFSPTKIFAKCLQTSKMPSTKPWRSWEYLIPWHTSTWQCSYLSHTLCIQRGLQKPMVIRKVSILLHTANAIFRPIKCKRGGLKNIIKLKHNEIIDRSPIWFAEIKKNQGLYLHKQRETQSRTDVKPCVKPS